MRVIGPGGELLAQVVVGVMVMAVRGLSAVEVTDSDIYFWIVLLIFMVLWWIGSLKPEWYRDLPLLRFFFKGED